jgi:flagellar biosynthesis/type III secretory pathway chaperone
MEDLDKIKEIYTEESRCYYQLLKLTKAQTELIKQDKLEELEQSLVKREEIINQISNLEKEVAPFKRKAIKRFSLDSEKWLAQLAECEAVTLNFKKVVNQLTDITQQLTKINDKNRKLIEKNKQEVGKELNEVKKKTEVNNSYTQNKRVHSTFIDEKS